MSPRLGCAIVLVAVLFVVSYFYLWLSSSPLAFFAFAVVTSNPSFSTKAERNNLLSSQGEMVIAMPGLSGSRKHTGGSKVIKVGVDKNKVLRAEYLMLVSS